AARRRRSGSAQPRPAAAPRGGGRAPQPFRPWPARRPAAGGVPAGGGGLRPLGVPGPVDPASGSRRSHSRASAALLDLLTALAGAPAAQWLRDVPWPDGIGYHGGLAAWLVSF